MRLALTGLPLKRDSDFARQLIQEYSSVVCEVNIEDQGILLDIDTIDQN